MGLRGRVASGLAPQRPISTTWLDGGTWASWHDQHDDPRSALRFHLANVTGKTSKAIGVPSRRVQLVSMCAGQGHGVTAGALSDHARRGETSAVLLETDAGNVAAPEKTAPEAGLANLRVL